MATSEATDDEFVLPDPTLLAKARELISQHLLSNGQGLEATRSHLENDLTPGLSRSSQSSRYYGFVTGGALPAARFADNLVTKYDQNAAVHIPADSIATDVEYHALNMLCELLDLDPAPWRHRLFTTGATASNVLGLACAREWVIAEAGRRVGKDCSVAELGMIEAMRRAEIDQVQILTTVPHSSIPKAASIIGLGRSSVKDQGTEGQFHRFDRAKLEKSLSIPRTASIIMVSASEVNTGLFATTGLEEMRYLRDLADRTGAWIHIDAAFGNMARVLPRTDEYEVLHNGVDGIELGDSMTGDAHKLLNVPYDCGFFLSKHLELGMNVFQNPNAAYLATELSHIPSPLNIGIENSRRFRALPVYSNLLAYGLEGYRKMIVSQVQLARSIASYLLDSKDYELIAAPGLDREEKLSQIFIIVLFRARDDGANRQLVKRINATRKIYCSGTSWKGSPAARFAISNWQADVGKDLPVIRQVLEEVCRT